MRKALLALIVTLVIGAAYAGDCTLKALSHAEVIPFSWQSEKIEMSAYTAKECRAHAQQLMIDSSKPAPIPEFGGTVMIPLTMVRVKYLFDNGENIVRGKIKREKK